MVNLKFWTGRQQVNLFCLACLLFISGKPFIGQKQGRA